MFFDGRFTDADFYDRDRLRPGNRVMGPAVIVQQDSTTVIHPAHVGEVDPCLNVLIRPSGRGGRPD